MITQPGLNTDNIGASGEAVTGCQFDIHHGLYAECILPDDGRGTRIIMPLVEGASLEFTQAQLLMYAFVLSPGCVELTSHAISVIDQDPDYPIQEINDLIEVLRYIENFSPDSEVYVRSSERERKNRLVADLLHSLESLASIMGKLGEEEKAHLLYAISNVPDWAVNLEGMSFSVINDILDFLARNLPSMAIRLYPPRTISVWDKRLVDCAFDNIMASNYKNLSEQEISILRRVIVEDNDVLRLLNSLPARSFQTVQGNLRKRLEQITHSRSK